MTTPAQIRAARALLNISQIALAKLSGVSLPTIKRCESDDERSLNVTAETVTKIRTALEKAGVEFTNGRKPGAKLNPKIAKYPDSSSDAKGLAEDVQAGDPFADMVLSPSHCRMARAALQIGIRDLAKLAKVSPNTISRLERGEALNRSTLDAIQRAFTKAGVELIPENGGGAGVRLQRKSSQR